ncbi:heavy metal translocating P-type ATPase [Labrys okinawensis]|uniref:heavy metal translocating P-type ATPase n=1 Tax=Labrys okinawensis TaxID=346911 RepID=UPI0039BD4289
MSCCLDQAELAFASLRSGPTQEEIRLASRRLDGDLLQTDISIPTMHCGACIRTIEEALDRLPGVQRARANLSAKRVSIQWNNREEAPPLIETLRNLGYEAHLFDSAGEGDPVLAQLIRALAVAGFAASNIMILSVSVWAGAEPDTRTLFYWISALLALPALAYSGRVFYLSAWQALRHGSLNMDVPISIGVLATFAMSLYETVQRGPHAYFDAATSLLFVLLVGRTLDHLMRERARAAVKGLAKLSSRGALILNEDGTEHYLPVAEIEPGMTLLLAAGERVPVDARVMEGVSDIDCSLVTGEYLPRTTEKDAILQAGTLNLSAPLTLAALSRARDSFLGEMIRMMEAVETGRPSYRRIADRAARLYAPLVHVAALLALLGWLIGTGDWHRAILIAVSVLIITCPCALGLAVPMVQVAAARRLFEQGIMAKDGAALERLVEIDSVVFDKTGTLTCGEARLCGGRFDQASLALAAAIARHSRHPYSRALIEALRDSSAPGFRSSDVVEHPGLGLEARQGKMVYRLGRPGWAGSDVPAPYGADAHVLLAGNGTVLASFRFEDGLRPDACESVASLVAQGIGAEIISGDRKKAVEQLASGLGIPFRAEMSPGDKVARIAALTSCGRKVLMVGDGLNDAPSLAAAHASMAPASGADVGRSAADLVFLGESLLAVPRALHVARRAHRLIIQNFGLAIAYNLVAIPLAFTGLVTPLIAAIAMSLSSLVVVANAQRFGGKEVGPHCSTAFPRTSIILAGGS